MMKSLAHTLFKRLEKYFRSDSPFKFQHLTESQFPFQIEIENGEICSSRGFSHMRKNSIQTARYYHPLGPPLLLIKYYSRLGNVVFLLLFVLSVSNSSQHSMQETIQEVYIKVITYLLPTVLSFAVFVAKELFYDYQKLLQDRLINSRQCTIFRRMKRFFQQSEEAPPVRGSDRRRSVTSQKFTHMLAQMKSKSSKVPIYDIVRWCELEVGDIVFLKKHEVAPADLLILDISDRTCLILNQNMAGQTFEIERFPTNLTHGTHLISYLPSQRMKQNGLEYKKMLTGTLKYDKQEIDGRQGFIRLKKDPKGEDFTASNMILREQILIGCEFVFGMVLLSGPNCKCYQDFQITKQRGSKGSFFHRKADMFFLLSFFNIVLITLISWIIGDFALCRTFGPDENPQLRLLYSTFVFYLSSYIHVLPHYFYALVDAFELFNAIRKKLLFEQKRVLNMRLMKSQTQLTVPAAQEQMNIKYKQLNSCNLADMVMTEYACFDKTGTLTTEQLKVKAIMLDDRIYKFSRKKLKVNAWVQYKSDINIQLASNKLVIDESEDDSPESKQVSKSAFRLTLVQSASLKKKARNTFAGSDMLRAGSQKKFTEAVVGITNRSGRLGIPRMGESRTPSIRLENPIIDQSLEDMLENIKVDELEDAHCKISDVAKQQRPKPFLNRAPASIESSLMNTPKEIPMIQVLQQDCIMSADLTSMKLREKQNSESIRERPLDLSNPRRSGGLEYLSRRSQFLRKSYVSNQNGTKTIKADEGTDNDQIYYEDQEEFYKRMHVGLQSTCYMECVLFMVLCHQTTTKFVYSEDCFINDAQQQLDNQLLRFAEAFDIKFICSTIVQNKIIYVVEHKGELHEFQLLSYHKETNNHHRFGVLVKFPERLAERFGFMANLDDPEAETYVSVLILRDEVLTMPFYIDMDKSAKESWDKYLTRIHVNGYRTLVYSKAYLTEHETLHYMDAYESLRHQLVFDVEDFEELYATVEKNMVLVSVIGLEEKLRKNACETLQMITEAKLKPWILSGDRFNRVLPVAYKTRIIDKSYQNIVFDATEYEEIKVLIKTQLQAMNNHLKQKNPSEGRLARRQSISKTSPEQQTEKRSIKQQNSFSRKQSIRTSKLSTVKNGLFQDLKVHNLFINGDCFDIIYHDRYLYNHFCFILYFSHSLVGYNLRSQQKAQLIDIIHKQFPGHPRALAIGDAYNDMIMFAAADISIQMQSALQGFNEHKDRLDQFKRKNSLFQNKTKFFHRIQSTIRQQNVETNPTKKAFINRLVWQVPTADFFLQKFEDFQWLLFLESRLYAEIYDDLLMFAFYRGFLIGYAQMFWYAFDCGSLEQIVTFNSLMFYQTLLLVGMFVFHVYLKFTNKGHPSDMKDPNLYQQQFTDNIRLFKKKKLLAFIFKINISAAIEALMIIALTFPQRNQQTSIEGRLFPNEAYGHYVFGGVLLADLIKFSINAALHIKHTALFSVNMLLTICLIVLTSNWDDQTMYNDIPSALLIIKTPPYLMILFGYLAIEYVQHKFQYQILTPFFSQQMVRNRADYENLGDEYKQDQSITKEEFTQKVGSLYRKISNLAAKIFAENDDEEIDNSLQQMISGSNTQFGNEKLNPFTLQFAVAEVENKFRRLLVVIWVGYARRITLYKAVAYELILIGIYSFSGEHPLGAFFVFYVLSFSLQIVISWMIWTDRYEKHFFAINTVIVMVRVLCKVLYDIIETCYMDCGRDNILLTQLCSFIVAFTIVDRPLITMVGCLAQTISFMARQSSLWRHSDASELFNWYMILNTNVIALSSLITIAIIQYRIIYMERQDFLLDSSMNQETQQINDVLAILLPKFIRDRIDKSGQFDFSENQGEVSILFCDICGFDKIVNTENEKIVLLLDSLFRAFDQLCTENGMQKIETVGKTYMAAGGLKAVDQNTKFANVDPVKRAINQALEMQRFVKKFKFAKVGNLQIKIGIHYGRVIAGVIGHHKPQFSLIGDTVNTTSRVCSTGEDGQITISERAYEQADMPELSFEQRVVEAKGKGVITTYQVSTEVKVNRRYRRQKLNQDPKKKLNKKISVNIIEEEDNPSDKVSSKHLDPQSGEIRTRLQRKRSHNRTRLIKHNPSVQSFFRQQSQMGKSNNNIDQYGINTPKLMSPVKEFAREESEHVKERQNLIQVLEQELRKELVVEIHDENLDFEVDKDRARSQFLNEDGDLTDSKKHFYLEFETSQTRQTLAAEFYGHIAQQNYVMCCVLLWFSTACFCIKSFSFFMIQEQVQGSMQLAIMSLRLAVSVFYVLLSMALSGKYRQRVYQQNMFLLTFALKYFVFVFESCVLQSPELGELQISEGILIINLFTSIQLIHINRKLMILIMYLLGMLIILTVQEWAWRYLYYVLISGMMQFGLQYRQFSIQINNYNNKLLLEHKQQQQSNLVMYLLPQHILDEFYRPNQQRKALTDYCKDSTLLFADIAGFTEYSSHVEPEQVVNMLRNLFTEFDRTCLAQNTYKLYTIGDCYVVMGMTDANERAPAKEARNVVELGFLMIEIIRQVRIIINFEGLDMRIGVHTGNIIGGVLGTEIVRYDIYGADVMIANKMESNGLKGQVQVSEETKMLLESAYPYDFMYEFNKTIEFTAIGRKTNGYFIYPANNEVEVESISGRVLHSHE